MTQPLPDPDSPFAEFAQPKESALETFMQRKVRDHKGSVARWRFLGIGVAGALLGATIGVGIGVGPRALPLALGLGIVGALGGVLGGWVAGAMSWGMLQVRAVRGMATMLAENELRTLRGNQWDKLALWLTAWGLLGAVAGAALGAAQGAGYVENGGDEVAFPWGMIGSTIGLLIAVGIWLVTTHLRPSTAPPSSPVDGAG